MSAKTSFFAELQRRNVHRAAVFYAGAAWLLVQIATQVFPFFHIAEWVVRWVVVAAAVGFPFAMLFSWFYEWTTQGIKRESEIDHAESITRETGKKLDKAIIAVLGLAVVLLLANTFIERKSAPAVAADKSIAVLPFVNMSSDKEQEYFSDGLSEELLNQLAQIPQLRVIARTSSFSFKGREVDVAMIAKALNVENVLEGSVRKSGNTLRITAQLVRASDSSHPWSQTYDRDLTEVFKVQDEISGEVVNALKLKLLPSQQIANTQHTKNPEAYDQYLLGRKGFAVSDRQVVEISTAALERAIALDPQYANAYAALAHERATAADFAIDDAESARLIREAVETADKAIALAPNLSEAYTAGATIRNRRLWDWPGADADYQRALALDPNDVIALTTYAGSLFYNGHANEAIALDRKATTIDPLSASAWSGLGWHLADAGHAAEARVALQRAAVLDPKGQWSNFNLGYLELKERKTDSALAYFNRAPDAFRLTGAAMTAFTLGHEPESLQALAELKARYAVGFAYQIAQVHVWRGERDQAFVWLDRAYAQHDAGMPRLRYDPIFAGLRGDPRFAAIVRKMRLPE